MTLIVLMTQEIWLVMEGEQNGKKEGMWRILRFVMFKKRKAG